MSSSVRRAVGLFAAVLVALGVVALAQPAQAASRSTWCSTWKNTTTVTTTKEIGRIAERTCVQTLSTGQIRTVAQVRFSSALGAAATREARRVATATASPSVSASTTAAPVVLKDRVVTSKVVIRQTYRLPGQTRPTLKTCVVPAKTYSDLADEDLLTADCYTPYVPRKAGTAFVKTSAAVTSRGTVYSLPATAFFSIVFAS